MPNWCNNVLTVEGDAEQLQKFLKDTEVEEDERFHPMNLHPTPEDMYLAHAIERELMTYDDDQNLSARQLELEMQIDAGEFAGFEELYGAKDWYDWNVKNWGTKWEVHMHLASKEDTSAHFHFESAWSPPTSLFDAIAPKYPLLSFTLSYEELGCDFAGAAHWANGKFIDEMTVDLSEDARYAKALEDDPDFETGNIYDVVADIQDECIAAVQKPKNV